MVRQRAEPLGRPRPEGDAARRLAELHRDHLGEALSAALLALLLTASPKETFFKGWDDYKAELSGYALTQPRYGEARKGEAVLVFVMEPFSKSMLIKPDHPDAKSKDLAQVLKLNQLRRFVTGIYDYALMTSVFVPVVFDAPSPNALCPLKVAFSAQEWCGTVYQELRRTDAGYQSLWHSYFESEGSGSTTLALSADTLLEDELFIRLREPFGPLKPGRYDFIAGLASQRLSHEGAVTGSITLTRSAKPEAVTVPAGTFSCTRWDLELAWGKDGRLKEQRHVWVEAEGQRRIIAWEGQVPGFGGNEPMPERGELTGSIRDTYWEHHRVVDEPLRSKLGLKPR